jgi:Tfp pilus assembly protein PilW
VARCVRLSGNGELAGAGDQCGFADGNGFDVGIGETMSKHPVFAHAMRVQAGFTMLELMVSVTISFFILLAVTNIFIANQQTLTAQSGNALMTDNGRIGLAVIGRLLKQSGYCDEASYSNTNASGNWVVPCNHINSAAASGSAGSDGFSQISLSASAAVSIASGTSSFTLSNGNSTSLSAMGQKSDTLTISYITGPQASSNTAMPDCLGNPSPAASNVIVTNRFYIKVQGVGTGSSPQVVRPQLMCDVSWTDINGNALSSALTSSLVSSGLSRRTSNASACCWGWIVPAMVSPTITRRPAPPSA